jgi:23S rRNA (pseudouridine1915-N3)-methyltransferase
MTLRCCARRTCRARHQRRGTILAGCHLRASSQGVISERILGHNLMKLVILAVGRGRAAPEQTLVRDWLGRLPQGGAVIEVESKLPAGPARTRDEGERLLKQLPATAPLIACDPHGRDTSSEALATLLQRHRDDGAAAVYFAIGGADGHDRRVLDRAPSRIAFGSATWPHMLFRAMLAEQLYRASMILAGHPYHRG